MQSINGLFEWIDENNQVQSSWALSYLLKLGERTFKGEGNSSYENLMISTQSFIDDEHARKIVRKMRGAWSQKKLRDSRVNCKSYNFVLSTTAEKRLTSLSQVHKITSSKTIEMLIEIGFKYEEEAKKAGKERKSEIEARAKKSADRFHRKSKEILKAEIRFLGVKYEALKKKYEEQCDKYTKS